MIKRLKSQYFYVNVDSLNSTSPSYLPFRDLQTVKKSCVRSTAHCIQVIYTTKFDGLDLTEEHTCGKIGRRSLVTPGYCYSQAKDSSYQGISFIITCLVVTSHIRRRWIRIADDISNDEIVVHCFYAFLTVSWEVMEEKKLFSAKNRCWTMNRQTFAELFPAASEILGELHIILVLN